LYFFSPQAKFIREKYQPSTAQEYHLLAKDLGLKKKYKKAEEAAFQALRLNPRFAKAYMDLGNIYHETGSYIKAIKMYLEALQNIGDDRANLEVLYFDLGSVLVRERRQEASWEYLRKALAMRDYLGSDVWKDSPQEFTYFVLKNDQEGFRRNFLKQKGLPPEVAMRLRRIRGFLFWGRKAKAIAECREYLRDNFGSLYCEYFYELLASVLSKKGEFLQSNQILDKLSKADLPTYRYAWIEHLYGYNCFRLGQYGCALVHLQKVLRKDEDYYAIQGVYHLIFRIISRNANPIVLPFLNDRYLPMNYASWVKHMYAVKFVKAKRPQAALRLLDSIITQHKTYRQLDKVMFLKSKILIDQDKLSLAESVLRGLIKQSKNPAMKSFARLSLAYIYEKKGEYKLSFKEYLDSGILAVVIIMQTLGVLALSVVGV
jgi:tetratricopeptide (TPR) repeat protein